MGRDVGKRLLDERIARFDDPAGANEQDDDERQRQCCKKRQPRAYGNHEGEGHDAHEYRIEEADERHAGSHPDGAQVVDKERHEIAGLRAVVKGRRRAVRCG